MHDDSYNMDAELMGDPLDPRLEALLNEALSPETVEGGFPADLDSRIMAALPLHELRAPASPVIARIGFFASPGFRRLAAMVAIVFSLGVVLFAMNALRDLSEDNLRNRLAIEAQLAEQTLATARQHDLADLRLKIEQIPVTARAVGGSDGSESFAFATTIDSSIDTLKSRTNNAALTAEVDSWMNVTESLEAALNALETEPNNG